MISNKIKEMWLKEGWEYKEVEDGFCFEITFPFDKLTRYITVYFKNKPKNYYYIEVKLTNGEMTQNCYEYLYVEPKEHMLIHNTILELGWVEDGKRSKFR